MRVAINFNDSKQYGGYQVVYCDETGDLISYKDLENRIILSSFINKYDEVVLVLSDYTFHQVLDGNVDTNV